MINNPENNWRYLPNDAKGEYKYDGEPCPSKKVLKVIGKEGIAEIDEILKTIIEVKKRIFGVDSELITFSHVGFRNDKERLNVICEEVIFGEEEGIVPEEFYAQPQKAVSGNYTIRFGDEDDETGE